MIATRPSSSGVTATGAAVPTVAKTEPRLVPLANVISALIWNPFCVSVTADGAAAAVNVNGELDTSSESRSPSEEATALNTTELPRSLRASVIE